MRLLNGIPVLLMLFFLSVSLGPAAERVPVTEYKIGTGDLLEISVWKDAALSRQVIVLPDGKIQFPLIGEITARGKTVSLLKDELVDKIHPFVPDPVLLVSVVQVNSLQVYVIGKVNRPGRFNLNRNINVIQALAMAGGLNPFAKEKKIKICRKENGIDRQFRFNYAKAAEGENPDQNILLQPGDVIVVP